MIRLATLADVQTILALFEVARQRMWQSGNTQQWGAQYPNMAIIEQDIHLERCYVIESDNVMVATFVLASGEDPTYQVIEQGQWRLETPYLTIHRLASNGVVKGIARQCFDFACQQSAYLRIDTHADNHIMQAEILRYGFEPCGIIYVADGSPRLAYDYIVK